MISTYGNFIVLEIWKFRFRGYSAKSENPNAFIFNLSQWKRETLTKHLKSKSHVYCRDCYLSCSGRSKAATQQEALPGVLTRQKTAQRADLQRELEVKFNVAYTRATEELPFTMYWPLLFLLLLLKKELSSHQTNVQQQRQMRGIFLIFFLMLPVF